MFLALMLAVMVEGRCVSIDPTNLLCTNEFHFQEIYPKVESLELNSCFIAHQRISKVFPSLKYVRVLGNLVKEQCSELLETDLEVEGCKAGK